MDIYLAKETHITLLDKLMTPLRMRNGITTQYRRTSESVLGI